MFSIARRGPPYPSISPTGSKPPHRCSLDPVPSSVSPPSLSTKSWRDPVFCPFCVMQLENVLIFFFLLPPTDPLEGFRRSVSARPPTSFGFSSGGTLFYRCCHRMSFLARQGPFISCFSSQTAGAATFQPLRPLFSKAWSPDCGSSSDTFWHPNLLNVFLIFFFSLLRSLQGDFLAGSFLLPKTFFSPVLL